MKGRKTILSENGFVEKLMELDNYVHWLTAVRALKKSKNEIPMDTWQAILDTLLRFAGTKRAKELLSYEVEDRKTGTPLCGAKSCRERTGCIEHCPSCWGALTSRPVVPHVRTCAKCKITLTFGVVRGVNHPVVIVRQVIIGGKIGATS
jgi:hypothetical protein